MLFHVLQLRGTQQHRVGSYPERTAAEWNFVRAVEVGQVGDVVELVAEGDVVSRYVIGEEESK